MAAIIELAERLGKLIADSPQAAALRAARDRMDQHPDVGKMLEDFRDQQDKIARLEAENKPVEVDEKHRLQDLHAKLVGSEAFKQLTAAQVEYVDLMRKVNEAIGRHLGDTEGGE